MKRLNINIIAFGLLVILTATIGNRADAQNMICEGEQFCLTTTARGQIDWYGTTDSVTWNHAGSGDTLCLTITAPTWYRAAVTEGTCDTIWSDTTFVDLYPTLVADAGPDTVVCTTGTVMIGGSPTASGGVSPYTYLWAPGGSLSSTTVANPLASYTSPTNYVLTVTDTVGCTAMDTVFVDTTSSAPSGSANFSFTGAVQYWVVPPCVDSVTLEAWGAEGGTPTDRFANATGGLGGYATGKLAVSSGDTLWVYVGQKGDSAGAAAFNGGGVAGYGTAGSSCFGSHGGGGGGASDVRLISTGLGNRVIVGGGGGGAGADYCNGTCQPCGCGGGGGGAGGLNGGAGAAGYNCGWGYAGQGVNFGGGATQAAGGSAGPADGGGANVGTVGALGVGGNGSNGTQDVAGGGGGGGYYGGGGGGGASNGSGVAAGGGGGGSSYVGTLMNSSTQTGVWSGNGKVTISW